MRIMRRFLPILLGIAAILIAGYAMYSFFGETQNSATTEYASHDSPQEARWREEIRTRGAAAAYAEFVRVNQEKNIQEQHNNAHIFGSILYEEAGIEGLTVCDDSFSSGCYHEMFRHALAKEGPGAQETVVEMCLGKNDSSDEARNCYHAVGHGAAYYHGVRGLEDALAHCSEFEQLYAWACADGVFMEHISPGFMGDASRASDTPPEDVRAICERSDATFQRMCYTRFVQWWASHLRVGAAPETYIPEISSFCSTLPRPELEAGCAEAIGLFVITTWVDFEVETSHKLCSLLDNEGQRASCHEGVISRIMLEQEERADEVLALCPHTSREFRADTSSPCNMQ